MTNEFDPIPPNNFGLDDKVCVTVDFRNPIQKGDIGVVVSSAEIGTVRVLFPTRSNFKMSFWPDEIEKISEEEYETGILLES